MSSKTLNSKKENLNEYKHCVHFLLSCASMCCSAFVPFAFKSANSTSDDKKDMTQPRGDPTEIAILESADFCNVNRKVLFEKNVLVNEQAFDYKKKYMTTVRKNNKKYSVYMKGAPEAVLSNCAYILENSKIRKINKKDIQKINSTLVSYSKEGLRVLAVAYADSISKKDVNNSKFSNLCWVGLVGLIDPPRPQVHDAISACTTAGIRTVMLTGDSQLTARAIANQIGITTSKKNIISGDEIETMSDYDLRSLVKNLVLCYRATPDHKFRIINALQQVGEIVAVTGDGVNDAPSIKKADIGIAMGVGGTDVARSASDLVLLDNNFNTLVKAIEYGRSIFANILSFVRFQFTTNVAAITLMFTSPLLGLGLPLTPLQILWVNIIMDGPPALALGVEPPKKDSMLIPPRNPKKPLLSIDKWMTIFISAFLMAILTLIVFYVYLKTQPYKAQTMAFCTFVILQLANALNCRSYTLSVFNKFFSNKILLFALSLTLIAQISIVYISEIGVYFHTLALNVFDWSLIFSLGILIIVWGEFRKLIFAKFNSKSQVA